METMDKNLEKKGLDEVILDRMRLKDIARVHDISKESFKVPWSHKAIEEELFNDLAYYIVARTENMVVGFIGCWLVFEECQITNVAVKKEYRRLGIAEKLFNKLKDDMKLRKISQIVLEVRVSNVPAKTFYEKQGFKYCGLRKKFYQDKEDADLMILKF